MKIEVILNGGPVNVWHVYSLTCNPFPQIAKYEYQRANRMLQLLDSDPLASVEDVRRILEGSNPEFIDLCCQKFIPGARVKFTVEFPD